MYLRNDKRHITVHLITIYLMRGSTCI